MEFGVPQLILSDSGSQNVAAGNLILDFVKYSESQKYFMENNVKSIDFQHYPKGCNTLGGLVESCVKIVKRLIYGSIKNFVLGYFELVFIVCQTIHLANRRPMAFKEALREEENDVSLPSAITPEILLKGHELISVNLIPCLQGEPDDVDWVSNDSNPVIHVRDSNRKLAKCHN